MRTAVLFLLAILATWALPVELMAQEEAAAEGIEVFSVLGQMIRWGGLTASAGLIRIR